MKGLELLKVGGVYNVRTMFGEHPGLTFDRIEQENADVWLAVFTTGSVNPVVEICFDISLPTNQVKKV
jgi:hypothetical protein